MYLMNFRFFAFSGFFGNFFPSKIPRKNVKFDAENEKIGNSLIQSRKNVDDFWLKF